MTEIRFERVVDLESWRRGQGSEVRMLPREALGEAPWIVLPESVEACVREAVNRSPLTLIDTCEILVGLQTSADQVFQIRPIREADAWVEVEAGGVRYRIEREVIRPSLLDVQIASFKQPVANAYLLFPYNVVRGSASLIPAQTMQGKFPGAWKYLLAHQDVLVARDRGAIPQDEWYRYGRSQNLAKFDTNKVIVQVLAESPRYAFDQRNILVTGGGNGPYYILRPKLSSGVSLGFLLAVLTHPLVEAIVRSRGSDFRGAYFSRNRQALKDIPVPLDLSTAAGAKLHTGVVKLIGRVVGLWAEPERLDSPTRRTRDRVAARFVARAHGLISEAFGLADADLMAIERFLQDQQTQVEE